MKKFSTIAKIASVLLVSLSALTAEAQTAVQVGVPFVPSTDTSYTFTPTVNGTLTININSYPNFNYYPTGTASLIYSDESLNDPIKSSSFDTDTNETYVNYVYKGLTAGTTYYFSPAAIYKGKTYTFTMQETTGAETEGIKSVTPSTDNPFNYVQNVELQINATSPVQSFETVSVSYGNVNKILDKAYNIGINGPTQSAFLQIGGSDGAPAMKAMLQDIVASGAESFTLTITGLKAGTSEASAVYVTENLSGEEGITVDNGTVNLTYAITAAPEYLPKESTWPSTFYMSWEEGDPSGVATLKFNQDIDYVDNVTLVMGVVTTGEGKETDNFQEFNLNNKTTVQGNTVTIDFTGVTRRSTQKEITVMVQNVVGVNGMPVDMVNFGGTTLTMFQYIPYSATAAPENPSAIETIESEGAEKVIYNLQGVRVNKNDLKPGVYVVDGKKVIIK